MSLSKKMLKTSTRSPRSQMSLLNHLPACLQEQLTKNAALKVGGFSDMLWKRATDLENDALNTGFIQGIKSGLLDPTDYGGYTVQDAIYCYNATEYFKVAEQNAIGDETMTSFIQGRIKSYKEYTDYMFKQWHIDSPDGISMGHAAQWYSDFECKVAHNKQSFYLLIAMLPCEALWIWLANQIAEGDVPTNVYATWIQENKDSSHHLANFVDENIDKYDIDREQALKIYKGGMTGEVKFFQSASS